MTWNWSYIYGPILLAPFAAFDVWALHALIQTIRNKPIMGINRGSGRGAIHGQATLERWAKNDATGKSDK